MQQTTLSHIKEKPIIMPGLLTFVDMGSVSRIKVTLQINSCGIYTNDRQTEEQERFLEELSD